ncbi:MAG: AAA family ATPase [Bacteroidales bacterium]|jgi:DNA sulfur modification protein DndD|nr:AAA family ATPase [Bacteroidales bacterium]
MIIKEITIENFRSYYGENTTHFKDGLALFVGDNGDGKTTFFEALEWLFDTSKSNMDSRLISEKRISELSEFETDTLRVSMTFDHDGEKIVEKSFSFSKTFNNDIKTDNFQFKGFSEEGSQRIPEYGGRLLDRCFDTAIRKYCLFKGETELNVFNRPEALKYLIETFSNIRQFDPYVDFTEFAENQSNKVYQNAMKSDKQNSLQEKELRYKIEELRKNLNEKKADLRNNQNNADVYATKLNDIEQSKEASELLKSLNDRLKSLYDKQTKIRFLIKENYTVKLLDEQWILCGFSSIFEEYQKKVSEVSKQKRKLEDEEKKQKGKQEAYQEISTNLANGIIPLSIYIPDENTMKEMIEDEFCKVCGRKAPKDTDAYNFMVNKLDELLKSQQPKEKIEEKPLFPNNFIKGLEQKSISLGIDKDELNNLINRIKETTEFNEARKKDDRKIQEAIDYEEDNKKKILAQNDNLTEEQLLNAYHNISNWWQFKSDAEKKIPLLEKEIKEIEKNLQETQEKYDALAKTSVANTYCKIHTALSKIQKAFENAKEKNTQDFLSLLEEKSNQYLENLNIDSFYGIIRIIKSADGSAQIKLQDSNGTFVSSPNQALKTTMYMSVLFAVSELTTIKRENDYPLIFDAPTSSFTESKESDFFNVISDIKKQCIIFTKSFLIEDKKNKRSVLDNEKIESLNGAIFRIEKKRPFNEKDLSTIQTIITPIK